MENSFIVSRVKAFKEKYPQFKSQQDYIVFTGMCIYYFYFTSGDAFDPDQTLRSIVDGANDGGIDAVLNDPSSEGNDLIIVQSKYYNVADVTQDKIVGELSKIADTVKRLDKYKIEGLKQDMVSAYRTAVSEMEDNGSKRIVFFTSDEVPNKKTKNSILKAVQGYFPDFDVELNFCDDIQAQIELSENGKTVVEYDELDLDEPDNALHYEDSIIVNISAKSLQDLQNRRRSSLLGMNLRYHIAGKNVDDAIAKTIKDDSANFWYKNNGILIVCDKYQCDGTKLKLTNFSIVNGGQTTYKIGQCDLPDEDFYLQCKVVKAKGATAEQSQDFVGKIAEATNSQKPIKTKDLKANRPEQWKLKSALADIGFYYMPKNGDKPSPAEKYPEPYNSAKLEKVGKVCLAGVLQMPGSARSNSQKMYDDQYYYSIFGTGAVPQVIVDLIKIDYFYDKYSKSKKVEAYTIETQQMIKNGRTFVMACLLYAVKLNAGCFTNDEINDLISDTDELKRTLRKMDGVSCVIANKLDNEKDVLEDIFGLIGDEVLGYCFDLATRVAINTGKSVAPSDYLKLDSNYYKDIISRFNTVYSTKKAFKDTIDKIILKAE